MKTTINIDGKKIAEQILGGNEMNNQANQPKSVWKCECANCGNVKSIKTPQGVTPRYCSQCGSETNYREVAENETAENKKTPQDVRDQGERVTYYVSERIVNISDLETLISRARFSLLNLEAFLRTAQDLNEEREVIAEEAEFAKVLLEQALGFRFLIERRKTFIENSDLC